MEKSSREAEASHRSTMAALVAEHTEATEQAVMRTRELEEERESQLDALKTEHIGWKLR